jgi:DNA-binding transcriptional ArsR family regulator
VPLDRTLAQDLTGTLTDLYGNAAQRIAEGMARRLRQGIGSPDWAGAKLGSINDLRNAVSRLIVELDADIAGPVHKAVATAWDRGGQSALDDLGRRGGLTEQQLAAIRQALPGAEAINRLAFSLASTLRGTHLRILRWSLDTYRQVIATAAAPPVLMGVQTRLAAAQVAWERFLERGITGFVDRSGRSWQLASYVEMATRTTVAQAAVEGHLDRLKAAGIDLVIVSNAPQECARCRPWEGKVLARASLHGARTIEMEHAIEDDRIVQVRIAGTVNEAVAAGLMHPNCRHSLSAYLPGVTKAPTNTEDPEGDKARQQLRALERKVRAAKLQAAAALDPAARKVFEAKVRALQKQIRDHIDNAPADLFRQPHREQIGTAR